MIGKGADQMIRSLKLSQSAAFRYSRRWNQTKVNSHVYWSLWPALNRERLVRSCIGVIHAVDGRANRFDANRLQLVDEKHPLDPNQRLNLSRFARKEPSAAASTYDWLAGQTISISCLKMPRKAVRNDLLQQQKVVDIFFLVRHVCWTVCQVSFRWFESYFYWESKNILCRWMRAKIVASSVYPFFPASGHPRRPGLRATPLQRLLLLYSTPASTESERLRQRRASSEAAAWRTGNWDTWTSRRIWSKGRKKTSSSDFRKTPDLTFDEVSQSQSAHWSIITVVLSLEFSAICTVSESSWYSMLSQQIWRWQAILTSNYSMFEQMQSFSLIWLIRQLRRLLAVMLLGKLWQGVYPPEQLPRIPTVPLPSPSTLWYLFCQSVSAARCSVKCILNLCLPGVEPVQDTRCFLQDLSEISVRKSTSVH